MAIYILLGMPDELLNTWFSMHDCWTFKGVTVRGFLNHLRLTGQATTSLGNFLINLAAHAEFIKNNWNNIQIVLILGDDILINLLERVDVEAL